MSKIERSFKPSPEFRFFLYDPEGDGLTYYRTAADRDAQARGSIQEYLADGCWSEEVTGVCAGEVTLVATEVDRVDRPPPEEIDEDGCDGSGRYWEGEHDYTCNYAMKPL